MAGSRGGRRFFGSPKPHAQPVWWWGEDPVPLEPSADLPSNTLDNFSFQSYQTSITSLGGTFSELNTPDRNDKVIVVPARGSETPLTRSKLPGIQGSNTPEVQLKLSQAPVANVQHVAMRMYRTLKQHGLGIEAERAFKHLNEAEKIPEGKDNPSEELMGMDFILKDGIVSYLRDVARITPPIPQQVVRFMGVSYTAKVLVAEDEGYETFGKKLLGCLLGPLLKLGKKKKIVDYEVLKDIVGYVMPGSMTLLLGPPGCGKSSLLKVLAGRAEVNKKTVLEGTVMYNDREASEVLLTRLIAYINGQLNVHIPFLTVRETLHFAEDCTQGLRPENFSPQMRKFFAHALVEGQDPFLEYVLQVLGLKSIEYRLVGAGQEGITDNDRARLTTAEIALGSYSVLLYDQPFSGQDPLGTYDLVSTLRAISRIQQCSAVMSLVQLSEEVFDLFDRVILLSEGQILYQGPRQDVLHHFSKLGYRKPAHVDAGGFLQDIASGEGAQYMEPGRATLNLEELVRAYKLSDAYKDILRIVYNEDVLHTFWVESEPSLGLSIRTPSRSDSRVGDGKRLDDQQHNLEVVVVRLSSKVDYSRGIESTGRIQVGDVVTGISCNGEELQYIAVGTEDDQQKCANGVYGMLKNARGHVRLQVERLREEPEELPPEEKQYSRPFVQSWWASTKTLIRRQKMIAKRLRILILLRLIQVVILGIFGGTLFYGKGGQYDLFDINIIRGLGFVANMTVMLINMVQLPVYMLQRQVLYKQRSQRFFRASSYVVAHSTINIPQSFVEATLYAFCVFFLSGLSTSNGGRHFFEFWCLLFLVCYFGSTFVLLLSAIAPIIEAANALSGLIISMFLLFSGFVIFRSNIPNYWQWVYYANPLHWANVIFCISQIGDTYVEPCKQHLQDLRFCILYPDLSVGKAYLKFQELESSHRWLWLAYFILISWIVVVNILCFFAMNKIQFREVNQSLPRPEKTAPLISHIEEDLEDVSSISLNGFPMNGHFSETNESLVGEGEKPIAENGLTGNSQDDYDEELASVDESGRWRNSNIPVKPLTLSFYNLIFSAKDPRMQNERLVLNRVSGYAKPGTMLALIGSSKSGKTTLLKILAGRAPPGTLQGDMLVNGFKMNVPAFTRAVGFAERLDAHQPFLTVRESLYFSATLRLASDVSSDERDMHVDLVLELLGLFPVSNQLIGSIRNAAGRTYEIAKKITIAVELAANPSILFLDEPTSELDSVGARSIMNVLQIIAGTGRTVISTIQHPSARLLGAFTNVLILSTGGEQVYFGPVGLDCSELLNYFVSVPKVPRYSEGQNPITFVLDVLGAGINKREPVQSFDLVYRSSNLAARNADELQRLKRQNRRNALKPVASAYAATYWQQAGLVFLRTQRFLWRNTQYTFGRLTAAIALGFLLGSVYFRIKVHDTYSLSSRSLYIYMQLMLIGVVVSNNVIPQIGSDRLAYYREKRAQMYAPIFYPISWAVAEIPYLFVAAFAYVGIGNGMAGIGVDSFSKFLVYVMSVFIFTLCVTYLGMFLTIVTPQPMLAAFLVSIVTSVWITSSGVVVPYLRIDNYSWLFWSNPYQYVLNILTSVGFYCDTTTRECSACQPAAPCTSCPCDRLLDIGTFAWTRLKYVRSLRDDKIPFDFAVVSGMTLLFAVLAFLSFAFLKHNTKPTN